MLLPMYIRFLSIYSIFCLVLSGTGQATAYAHDRSSNETIDFSLDPRTLVFRQTATAGSDSGDFSCGPGKPCGNHACCGKDGYCGYGPTYCGSGCQSNCDAKAECGKFASTPGKGCPLNVCCSKFGFCGTTSDFCNEGCQSHCKVPTPAFTKSDSQKKIVGYYEGWSVNHACGQMSPGEIPVEYLTHLNFAFAYITPGDFRIVNMPDFPPEMFGQVTDLKQKNPNMKVMIALGGWTFNDPGATQTLFSDLASIPANRKTFIHNLIGFMSQYGFDGADIDWEYPGAGDRGGQESDGENFTKLLQEMKAAFGRRYSLTFTAPTSYWYLRHFDIKASSEAVDWINLMSYDLHGVWDRDNPIGSHVLAHTNLTEVESALQLFWRNDVDPNKIVMGNGFYGRSFKLSDPSCSKPGCLFSGPGAKGPCTDTKGILSYKEIQDILARTKAKPHYDDKAKVQYMVYGDSNWISFDNARTFQDKVDFANNHGLNGLMIWAVDIDDDKGTAIKALTGKSKPDKDNSDLADFLLADDPSKGHSTDDPSKCYISDCGHFCDAGWTAVGRCNTDQNGKNRCPTRHPDQARFICCPSFTNIEEKDCRWDDSRSSAAKTDCSGKCNIGEVELVDDSFGWIGDITGGNLGHYGDQCWRGYKTFCCKAGNSERYLDICTWTGCNEACPSDKPNVLTTDTGGPKSNNRCPSKGGPGGGSPFDPGESAAGTRKLCCPKPDSFKNCKWSSGKVCSTTCGINQITLDRDPRGPLPDGHTCDNGREQTFCCDPPGGTDRPLTPFDMVNLFPPEYLPPADAIPSYDLVSFGGRVSIGVEDPDQSGVAFFLIAGSSTAVTSMKKRDNPGLQFLSCPKDVFERPDHEQQTARIICTGSAEDCFRVQEGGVEGTVVQLPDECGGPAFARAVSLEPSQDQSVPMRIAKRRPSPTSAVYDFTFDFNIDLIRRDAGDYSIRMDYSNVPGYWSAVVDSPGIGTKKRGLDELVKRFYGDSESWYKKFNDLKTKDNTADEINIDLKHLVYDADEECQVDDAEVDEGISVGILGKSDVNLYYGFSLIATWPTSGKVQIHEAAGFVRPEGSTDANFKVGGSGGLDTSRSFMGQTMTKTFGVVSTKGHNVFRGWAWFQGYQETGVKLASSGGEKGLVSFDGYMDGRIVSDWGHAFINFPVGGAGDLAVGTGERQRKPDQVSSSHDVRLNPLGDQTPTGSITVSSTLRVGLQVGMAFPRPWSDAAPGDLVDISASQEVFAKFTIDNTVTQACLATQLGTLQESHLLRGAPVGWPDHETKTYVQELTRAGNKMCYDSSTASAEETNDDDNDRLGDSDKAVSVRQRGEIAKRAGSPKPGPGNRLLDGTFTALAAALRCDGCSTCVELGRRNIPCCGCVCLECKYGGVLDVRDTDEAQTGDSTPVQKRQLLQGEISEDPANTQRNDIGSQAMDKGVGAAALTLEMASDSIPYGAHVRKPVAAIELSDNAINARTRDTHLVIDNRTVGILDSRATPGDPVQSARKRVNFCSVGTFVEYLPFPNVNYRNKKKEPTYPILKPNWDADGRAQRIPQYFQNSSASCTSWSVGQLRSADRVIYRGNLQDAVYQTEHVFEAQTLARFFQGWMQQRAANTKDCSWIRGNLYNNPNPWPNAGASLADLVTAELGGIDHPDRLAVFLGTSNRLKGQLFEHVATLNNGKFDRFLPGDEQFTYLKQFGMIFYYMNTPSIWNSFCASYEGMYALFDQWDQAHPGQQHPANLAQEWKLHIKSELEYVSRQGRIVARTLNARKKPVAGLWYYWWKARWYYVMSSVGPYGGIGITGSCPNL